MYYTTTSELARIGINSILAKKLDGKVLRDRDKFESEEQYQADLAESIAEASTAEGDNYWKHENLRNAYFYAHARIAEAIDAGDLEQAKLWADEYAKVVAHAAVDSGRLARQAIRADAEGMKADFDAFSIEEAAEYMGKEWYEAHKGDSKRDAYFSATTYQKRPTEVFGEPGTLEDMAAFAIAVIENDGIVG
ncbi:hypothetical protein [Trueperella pyogenes]|uniref:hypothetical protein n=1 Tax=Trueperella pyogenes TaxID=1661 RepID=UPI00345CF459